jgi:Flp pilus assembly pilin Flp
MSAITNFFTDLHSDEDGASFLEYTVLLGIILAVSVAILTAVGGYANEIWDTMCDVMKSAAGSSVACPA